MFSLRPPSSVPWLLRTFISLLAPRAALLRFWDTDKRRDYLADHACPGYAFRAKIFDILGDFSPGAMQFLCAATHTAFPQPRHHCAACLANLYRQLCVVQCSYLSRLLRAFTTRTGSSWVRLCTERLRPAAHVVGLCLCCAYPLVWSFLIHVSFIFPLSNDILLMLSSYNVVGSFVPSRFLPYRFSACAICSYEL
jgi:hypothetical protein